MWSLVTEPIVEVRPHALVTADGSRAPGGPRSSSVPASTSRIRRQPSFIRGRDGRTLAEAWAGSMRAYLGTTVTGFPNLFLLLGPNSGLGHNSVVFMIEAELEHVLKALSTWIPVRLDSQSRLDPQSRLTPGERSRPSSRVRGRRRGTPRWWIARCAAPSGRRAAASAGTSTVPPQLRPVAQLLLQLRLRARRFRPATTRPCLRPIRCDERSAAMSAAMPNHRPGRVNRSPDVPPGPVEAVPSGQFWLPRWGI